MSHHLSPFLQCVSSICRFRDLLHLKYKSSTKAKKRRRVQQLKRAAFQIMKREQQRAVSTGSIPMTQQDEEQHEQVHSDNDDSVASASVFDSMLEEPTFLMATRATMRPRRATSKNKTSNHSQPTAKIPSSIGPIEVVDILNLGDASEHSQTSYQRTDQHQWQAEHAMDNSAAASNSIKSVGPPPFALASSLSYGLPPLPIVGFTSEEDGNNKNVAALEQADESKSLTPTPMKAGRAIETEDMKDVEPVSLEKVFGRNGSLRAFGASGRGSFRASFLADLKEFMSWGIAVDQSGDDSDKEENM